MRAYGRLIFRQNYILVPRWDLFVLIRRSRRGAEPQRASNDTRSASANRAAKPCQTWSGARS